MATETILLTHDDEWPALGASYPTHQREPSNNMNINNKVHDENEDEWEDIENPATLIAESSPLRLQKMNAPSSKARSGSSGGGDGGDGVNPKILRHSASSPSLRCLVDLENAELPGVLEKEESDSEQPEAATDGADDDDDDDDESFSMVTGVASVQSLSTQQTLAATAAAAKPCALSWKDQVAKLARDADQGSLPHTDLVKAKNNNNTLLQAQYPNQLQQEQQQQPRRPTKGNKKKSSQRYVIVVSPIKRCAKSMGDLPSLAEVHGDDNDNDNHDDGEILGDTDAMEFYHRKALGAANRISGLRMRPDEAKRKQFTLQKKAMQRTGQ